MKLALVLLSYCTVGALALDLTPQPDIKMLEGVKIPQLRFEDGKRSCTWRPPVDWRMRFEDGRLTFAPKDFAMASLELRVIPRAPGDVEVLAKPDSLPGYAAGFLPKSAAKIVFTGKNEGPFTINAIAAQEFLLEFQEPGLSIQASFNVVDLNERERLLIIITAPPKAFEEVRTAAVQSLFSWQGE